LLVAHLRTGLSRLVSNNLARHVMLTGDRCFVDLPLDPVESWHEVLRICLNSLQGRHKIILDGVILSVPFHVKLLHEFRSNLTLKLEEFDVGSYPFNRPIASLFNLRTTYKMSRRLFFLKSLPIRPMGLFIEMGLEKNIFAFSVR
jgi:hypothetical protein